MESSTVSAVLCGSNTVIKIFETSYALKAVTEQTADLLILVQHVDRDIREAKRLFQTREPVLPPEESQWTHGAISDAEKAIKSVAELIEPARIDSQARYGVGFKDKPVWIFRDDIRAGKGMTRLAVCHQTLTIVISSLHAKDIVVRRLAHEPANVIREQPPAYERATMRKEGNARVPRIDDETQLDEVQLQEQQEPKRTRKAVRRGAQQWLSYQSSRSENTPKSSPSISTLVPDALPVALDKVSTLLLEDEGVRGFFSKALATKGDNYTSQNVVRLLYWLGRRLGTASTSPVEHELARFLSNSRRDQRIVETMIWYIHRALLYDGENTRMDKLSERGTKERENIEPFPQLPESLEDQGNAGAYCHTSDDSANDEEDVEANARRVLSDFEEVKGHLMSSHAFARFKEEFEDFVEPFKNKSMWSKTMWDGNQRVRFDHTDSVPRLTVSDKLKLTAEQVLGVPIVWWPFKQPRQHLARNKIRIIWLCVSE